MTQTAEIIISCDVIGCKSTLVIDDPDRNYYTFSTDQNGTEDGWHIIGKNPSGTDIHMCDTCYKGSSWEKDDLYASHIDDKIKASKEGV